MSVSNADIAAIFDRLADLLEIEDANPFRVRAYRNAAEYIGTTSQSMAQLVQEGEDLSQLPFIGKTLADKIRVILATGRLPALEEVEERVPGVLSDLMKIGGLGMIRVRTIYRELGIRTLADLEQAVSSGQLRGLQGFGRTIEERVIEGIRRIGRGGVV